MGMKEFWKNRSLWQKGGIIGILLYFGVLAFALIMSFVEVEGKGGWLIALVILPLICATFFGFVGYLISLIKKSQWRIPVSIILMVIVVTAVYYLTPEKDSYVYCETDDDCVLTDMKKSKCCRSCSLEAVNKEALLQIENWRWVGCRDSMRQEGNDKWECDDKCLFPKSAYVAVCKGNACQKERRLFLTTDKDEYKHGEIVKVSIENHLDKAILIGSCAPVILEYKEDDEWTGHRPLCEVAFIDAFIKHQIKPGEKTVIKEFDTGYEYGGEKLYKKGIYRANLEYGVEDGEWGIITSEEFKIK